MPVEVFGIPWQDVALAIGGFVGICSKTYALYDTNTTWSRRSSLPNAIFFLPSIVALYSLGLYFSGLMSVGGFMLWTGIAIWRSPEEEDWIGRRST